MFGDQRVVATAGDDAAAIHHRDLVRLAYRRQAMGDDQRGARLVPTMEAESNLKNGERLRLPGVKRNSTPTPFSHFLGSRRAAGATLLQQEGTQRLPRLPQQRRTQVVGSRDHCQLQIRNDPDHGLSA